MPSPEVFSQHLPNMLYLLHHTKKGLIQMKSPIPEEMVNHYIVSMKQYISEAMEEQEFNEIELTVMKEVGLDNTKEGHRAFYDVMSTTASFLYGECEKEDIYVELNKLAAPE